MPDTAFWQVSFNAKFLYSDCVAELHVPTLSKDCDNKRIKLLALMFFFPLMNSLQDKIT